MSPSPRGEAGAEKSPPEVPLEKPPLTPEEASMRGARQLMVGLSLGLFFLPFVNGLAGGLAGGYRLGTVRRALDNDVMPALAWGTLIGFSLGIPGMSFAGVFAFFPAIWMFFTGAGLVLGALIGGALAPRWAPRLKQAHRDA